MVVEHDGEVDQDVWSEFLKSSWDGHKAYLAQRCVHRFGQYLAVADYGVGGR